MNNAKTMPPGEVKPGSRWRCQRQLGCFREGQVYVVTEPHFSHGDDKPDGWWFANDKDGGPYAWSRYASFESGCFIPADPAREASAAWVPRLHERVVASGVVGRTLGGSIEVDFGDGLVGWVAASKLRPEAAPAAPVGDVISTKEYDAVVAKLVLAQEALRSFSALGDMRNIRMELGDAKSARDDFYNRLTRAEQELLLKAKECNRLTAENRELRAKIQRRGGI